MCLLIFAHQVSPDYPLILAANRDEFHDRPTAAAEFWAAHPDLLAGRDLLAGGTWMGINRQGRFAAVTNYRDPSRTAPAPRSRGELCVRFLTQNLSAPQFLAELLPDAGEYAGFNLLLGDGQNMWHFSNSQTSANSDFAPLPPGIYGLSNAQLNTPWPKSEAGKKKLAQLLVRDNPADSTFHDSLAQVVSNPNAADKQALTEVGLWGEMDELLSAQFIITPSYGTRCSTTLWRNAAGEICWREQSFDSSGAEIGVNEESFLQQARGQIIG